MKTIKMRITAILAAAFISLSLTSCSIPFHAPVLTAAPITLKGDLMADLEDTNNAESITPDYEFTAAQTAFALHLLQQAVEQDGSSNLLLSPYSVMQALAMSAAGAAGNTNTEMERVLGGISSNKLNAYLNAYRTGQPGGKNCNMLTANSVWFPKRDNDIIIRKNYLSTINSYYRADAYQRTFNQSTIDDVNKWVDAKTGHRIQSVLQELSPTTKMLLINACVFDAKWETKYKKDQIGDHLFHTSDGTDQTVQMMNSKEQYALIDTNAKGFVKPYQDGRYAFAALLPDKGITVNDYITGLTPEHLQAIFENRTHSHVIAGLPKFSGEYQIDLKEVLTKMGMKSAFEPSEADFSGMTENGNCGLYIASVLHQTRIDVDENGTKAAAVTAVRKDVSAADPIDLVVTLDRPFLYCILDLQTNLPVFIGIRQSI